MHCSFCRLNCRLAYSDSARWSKMQVHIFICIWLLDLFFVQVFQLLLKFSFRNNKVVPIFRHQHFWKIIAVYHRREREQKKSISNANAFSVWTALNTWHLNNHKYCLAWRFLFFLNSVEWPTIIDKSSWIYRLE